MDFNGKSPDLGWSIHMNGGWLTQFKRMERWCLRFEKSNNDIDKDDFFQAFIENAFHLKEWLINSNSIKVEIIDEFFSSNNEMIVCRNLANSYKHFSLSHKNSQPPSELLEYSPGEKTNKVITLNLNKYNRDDLPKSILDSWKKFLKENKLNYEI